MYLRVKGELMQRLWLQEGARDAALANDPLPVFRKSAIRAGSGRPNSENPSESSRGSQRGPQQTRS